MRWREWLTVGVIASFLLAGCGSSAGSAPAPSSSGSGTPPQAAQPVQLGALLSLKGSYASVGGAEQNALQLAFDQINQAGGILGRQIKLTIYDDEGDQAKAQQLASRLAQEDKVAAAFGPGITAMASVASPVFEQNQVLNINFTAQREIWQDKTYVWSAVPEDLLMSRAMIQYATTKLQAKKIAVLYSSVQYGVHGNDLLNQAAKLANLPIVADEKWGEGTFDFTSVIGRIKSTAPDAILLWGSGAPTDAQIVKQLRDQGVTTGMVGNTAYVGQQLLDVAGKTAEGFTAVTLMNWINPDKETAAFADAYQTKYSKPPTAQAAYAFDGAYRYKAAVEKAGSFEPAKVAAAMVGLKVRTVQGSFEVTKDDHVGASSPELYHPLTVKTGKWATP